MNQYLHLRCGAVECLLDIASVQEVGTTAGHDEAAGRRLWRGQPSPVLDLVGLFEQDGPRLHQVVVQDDSGLLILEVGTVLGLISAAPSEFQPFLAMAADTEQCFDQALARPDGSCLLRLRHPFDWLQARASV